MGGSRVRPRKPDPPAPEPTPEPITPAPTAGPITAATPFRRIGDAPRDAWGERLTAASSPLLPEIDGIIRAASPHGALALAQAIKESELGKTAPAGTKNSLGLFDYTGKTPVTMVDGKPFMRFYRWTDAFAEFSRRLSDLTYKGGVYGPADLSLEGQIVTYVAGPDCWKTKGRECANQETWVPGGGPDTGSVNLYLHQSIERLNAILGGTTPPPPKPPPEPPPQPVTDPMRVITGGVAFGDDYGWLADAGLNYYEYGVGHGTERSTQHPGVDLALPCNTALSSPAPGVVDCVGKAGTPRWGQSCGAYADVDGGGVGNITILLDGGVKLTLGHCRQASVKPGDRVKAEQQVGTVGSMNGCHVHVETSVERSGTYWLVEPRAALRSVMTPTPTPPKPDPVFPWPVQWVTLTGSTRKVPLPTDCPFRKQLTPIGPNRSQRSLNWTGVTQHETGNRGAGTGAAMHANWQQNGTPGHPDDKVGVHFYVDDKEIVQTIPVNEQGVHSGDWRNQQHVAIELCVNADRDAARAERNSKALCAALLGWGMR